MYVPVANISYLSTYPYIYIYNMCVWSYIRTELTLAIVCIWLCMYTWGYVVFIHICRHVPKSGSAWQQPCSRHPCPAKWQGGSRGNAPGMSNSCHNRRKNRLDQHHDDPSLFLQMVKPLIHLMTVDWHRDTWWVVEFGRLFQYSYTYTYTIIYIYIDK